MHLLMCLRRNRALQLSQGGPRGPEPAQRRALSPGFRLFKNRATSRKGKEQVRWSGSGSWHGSRRAPRIFSSSSNGSRENRLPGLQLLGGSMQAQGTGLRGRTAPGSPRVWWPHRGPNPNLFTACVIMASYSPSLCLSLPSWEVEVIMVTHLGGL